MSHSADDVPEFVIGDREADVLDLLRQLQRGALVHPEATRALFNAFATEGRSFARTKEGGRLKERLLGSPLVERAVLVWQSATLWVTEDEHGVTPSALVDAVAAAAASPRRDVLLDALFRGAEADE